MLQTLVDGVKLLNKPSALNNMNSFLFLLGVMLISFTSNYYMMVVLIVALMITMLKGIMMSSNAYSIIRGFRLVVLA